MPAKPLIAVYPGTFDPITNGHLDIIHRALNLFDQVIIAVAENKNKNTLLDFQQRVSLTQQVFSTMTKNSMTKNSINKNPINKHLIAKNHALKDYSDRVSVVPFSGLLTDLLLELNLTTVIRGLRAVSDFEYEFSLAGMNRKLLPEIETVYLMPGDEYLFISSTFVREVALLNGDIKKFVPQIVCDYFATEVKKPC